MPSRRHCVWRLRTHEPGLVLHLGAIPGRPDGPRQMHRLLGQGGNRACSLSSQNTQESCFGTRLAIKQRQRLLIAVMITPAWVFFVVVGVLGAAPGRTGNPVPGHLHEAIPVIAVALVARVASPLAAHILDLGAARRGEDTEASQSYPGLTRAAVVVGAAVGRRFLKTRFFVAATLVAVGTIPPRVGGALGIASTLVVVNPATLGVAARTVVDFFVRPEAAFTSVCHCV